MTEGTYPGTERKQEAEVAWDDLAAAMRNLERAFSGPPPAAAESRRLKKLLAQSVTHLAAAMDALERASPASQDVEAALARAERALVESAAGLRELQDDLIPASCRRDAGNRYSYPFLAGSPHDTVSVAALAAGGLAAAACGAFALAPLWAGFLAGFLTIAGLGSLALTEAS